VHAADVDGDGDVDVLGAALHADAITWWEERLHRRDHHGSRAFRRLYGGVGR